MKHAAGCPEIDASGMVAFMHNYPWVVGIIFVLAGPVIGMRGRRMFPWMVAVCAAIITFLGLLLCFTVFGWMEETTGMIISIISALLAAAGMCWFAKWSIRFEVMLFGCIGGWFAGETLYSFIVAASGYDELWLFITLQVVIVLILGVLTYYFAKQVILWSTSGVGSYLFIRGFSYFFGGWPSMSDILAM